MELDNCKKILITAAIGLVLVYLLFKYQSPALANGEGNSEGEGYIEGYNAISEENGEQDYPRPESVVGYGPEGVAGEINDVRGSDQGSCVGETLRPTSMDGKTMHDFNQRDYAQSPDHEYFQRKFNRRNKAQGEYKRTSYSESPRGNLDESEWDEFFDRHNNIIASSQVGENGKFIPVDESGQGYAAFRGSERAPCGSNQNCSPEDLFQVDNYLPQEVNDDWFEVQPEPVSVKNRHLINVTKPIGINTIGTSLRNPSYDFRGTPANPKFIVSPWLQSSIEPDTNLKPLL